MGSRLVIEKPTTTYREAAIAQGIAQGAEEQHYGGAQKAQKAPTEERPRSIGHEREAHLNHRASARELRERASSVGPRIDRRSPEDDYARAVGRMAPLGMRDGGARTDEERRPLAGLASADRAFIDEIARGLQEAAVDLPALAGLPTVVGKGVLDALQKFGKGGPGGGGRAGGFGEVGQGGGSPIDTSLGGYAPGLRVGQPGSSYGGRTPRGSGSGGGPGGFAQGFTGSGYLPGRGDAMDPKSPTGRSLGIGAPAAGGIAVPVWNPRGRGTDLYGERYGGHGLPGTRPDAFFRAQTWEALNPAGDVTDGTEKPKDEKPPPPKGDDKKEQDKLLRPKQYPISKDPDENPEKKAEADAKRAAAEKAAAAAAADKQDMKMRAGAGAAYGAIIGGLMGAAEFGAGGAVAGAWVGAAVGGFLGALSADVDPRKQHRPADDGTGPSGPRSASRHGRYRPADDGNSPTGPRSATSRFAGLDAGETGPPLGRGRGVVERPAEGGTSTGPIGPRIRASAGTRWSGVLKPDPEDPRPGGPQ